MSLSQFYHQTQLSQLIETVITGLCLFKSYTGNS